MTPPTLQRSFRATLLLLVSAGALLLANPASASPAKDGLWAGQRHAQANEGISRAQAAEIAQRQLGGRVLSVKRSRDGQVWKVKLLLDKERVRNVSVDAQSGQLR